MSPTLQPTEARARKGPPLQQTDGGPTRTLGRRGVGRSMLNRTLVLDTDFDWSQIDLTRHSRMTERAGELIERLCVHASGLEEVLHQFVGASAAAGGVLRHHRDPCSFVWHLSLEGPGYRATGTVELTLATVACVAILARPDGGDLTHYEVLLGQHDDFGTALMRQFRAAIVSSVLDAARIVVLRPERLDRGQHATPGGAWACVAERRGCTAPPLQGDALQQALDHSVVRPG